MDRCVQRNRRKEVVGGNMSKKLISATILIVLAEALSLSRMYFTEGTSNLSSFTSGVLLGLSVGMEIVGIILLLICIATYDKKDKK